MATEISNGKQTVKLYPSVNRGKAMCQLAYYAGGRRVQKNLADKSDAIVHFKVMGNPCKVDFLIKAGAWETKSIPRIFPRR